MKKHFTINMSKTLSLLMLSVGVFFMSCQGDFTDINKDGDRATEEDLNKDNLWALFIQSIQLTVMSQDPNTYQVVDDMHANTYSMYHGEAAGWNGGNNSTNYHFDVQDYHGTAFEAAYGALQKTDGKDIPGVMNSWNQLRSKYDENSIVFAMAQVMKVAGMHRVTDTYGPIPYIKFGEVGNAPYDSQESVYNKFFEELDQAIEIMTDYQVANLDDKRPIPKFDLLYGSDVVKWIKFANSLKLRLAMRISYVAPDKAKTYAEQAVSHQYGVMESADETAMIKTSSLYPFENPLPQLWRDYGETRMGASMESILTGYNDPRLPVYFNAVNGAYKGMRNGMSDAASYNSITSTPNIEKDSPLYWLNASEVYFLRAEGAINGWNMLGTANDLYNKGIETSMAERGVNANLIGAYINNGTDKPAPYYDPKGNYNVTSGPTLSTITIRWEEGASVEEKRERIITQKWIAMYPNGMEAWSEFRRTGYPKLFLPTVNKSQGKISEGKYIKRLPLPNTEHQRNKELTTEAVNLYLNGDDSPGTRLWWDTTED